MEINAMNVNEALSDGLEWLKSSGVREDSRNGPVIVSPEPVMTTYRFPMERVLFSPKRDANPWFHLMEALWMIAGRQDVKWPLYFNSKFGAWSDDGKIVHGAYGHRWRRKFLLLNSSVYRTADQLSILADELRMNPTSRRCVLQMWSVGSDLSLAVGDKLGRDVPCNTHVYFDVKDGLLNQTVCCRSNDIIWGAYGANAVHMSVLLEYMAARAGLGVGGYRQFSNNFHLYPALYTAKGQCVDAAIEELAMDARINDHYMRDLTQSPIINTPVAEWDADLFKFMSWTEEVMDHGLIINNAPECGDPFFSGCAIPMFVAWMYRKTKRGTGLKQIDLLFNYPDWEMACRQWIERREERKNANT